MDISGKVTLAGLRMKYVFGKAALSAAPQNITAATEATVDMLTAITGIGELLIAQ
jgi:hypothetical protein